MGVSRRRPRHPSAGQASADGPGTSTRSRYGLARRRLSQAHFQPWSFVAPAPSRNPHAYLLTPPARACCRYFATTDRSVLESGLASGCRACSLSRERSRRVYRMSPTASCATFPPAAQHALVPACVQSAPIRAPAHRTFRETAFPPAPSIAQHHPPTDTRSSRYQKNRKRANAHCVCTPGTRRSPLPKARNGGPGRRNPAREANCRWLTVATRRSARRRDRADGIPGPPREWTPTTAEQVRTSWPRASGLRDRLFDDGTRQPPMRSLRRRASSSPKLPLGSPLRDRLGFRTRRAQASA